VNEETVHIHIRNLPITYYTKLLRLKKRMKCKGWTKVIIAILDLKIGDETLADYALRVLPNKREGRDE